MHKFRYFKRLEHNIKYMPMMLLNYSPKVKTSWLCNFNNHTFDGNNVRLLVPMRPWCS